MNVNEAKELLSFHSGRNSDIHNPKWENGFLGSLRPFRGDLPEENFHEIMECMKAVSGEFNKLTVDHNIVADIAGIIYLTRNWASPEGMLGSNHLLSEEQTQKLLLWIDIMEDGLLALLEGDTSGKFSYYEDYFRIVHCLRTIFN